MSDLVNRLRGQYQVGPNGVYGTRSFADFIPPISLEAADEIEKLEQENQRLREQYNELIMAVAQKWPNESRHETALRYTKQAEAPKDHQCVAQNKE